MYTIYLLKKQRHTHNFVSQKLKFFGEKSVKHIVHLQINVEPDQQFHSSVIPKEFELYIEKLANILFM